MKPSTRRYNPRLFLIALSISFLIISLFAGVRSTAQSTQQETKDLPPWQVRVVGAQHIPTRAAKVDIAAQSERIIENQIPFHLPIKVELNNIDKEPLLSNLEVKVTNIGTKPIYFLEIVIGFPKTLSQSGVPLCFPLRYGRMAFLDLYEKVQPEDVPIQPGESFIFKIAEDDLKAFESHLAKMNSFVSDIKLIYLYFQHLNFGDGTGFTLNTGKPLPNVNSGKTSSNSCAPTKKQQQARVDVNGSPPISLINTFLSHFSSPNPYAQANSYSLKFPPQAVCCPGPAYSSCTFLKPSTYSCYCGEGQTAVTTNCSDPRGSCSDEYQQNRTCTIRRRHAGYLR